MIFCHNIKFSLCDCLFYKGMSFFSFSGNVYTRSDFVFFRFFSFDHFLTTHGFDTFFVWEETLVWTINDWSILIKTSDMCAWCTSLNVMINIFCHGNPLRKPLKLHFFHTKEGSNCHYSVDFFFLKIYRLVYVLMKIIWIKLIKYDLVLWRRQMLYWYG